MQGSMRRSMMHAIETGHCLLGLKGFRDYYSNIFHRAIRFRLTPNAATNVVEHMGVEWADNMKAVV
jgi:hypothetical protein